MLVFNSTVLLEAWLMVLNTFHQVFTILFIYNFIRIILSKYSPYSQMYIAAFLSIQVAWNGCPISGFINIFNNIGNYEYELNGFFFGSFLEWAHLVRFLSIFMIGLLYWSAYETWFKVDYDMRFSQYFKRGDFKMGSLEVGISDLQVA